MKIIETLSREKGFVLWGYCQNLLDDPRTVCRAKVLTCLVLHSRKNIPDTIFFSRSGWGNSASHILSKAFFS